jgi:ABC-type Fe3+ transport system permease subunit
MRRAYLLIVIPGVVIGIGYVVLLRYLGLEIHAGPFLGTAAAFIAALLIVRRYQRRKPKRHGSS